MPLITLGHFCAYSKGELDGQLDYDQETELLVFTGGLSTAPYSYRGDSPKNEDGSPVFWMVRPQDLMSLTLSVEAFSVFLETTPWNFEYYTLEARDIFCLELLCR